MANAAKIRESLAKFRPSRAGRSPSSSSSDRNRDFIAGLVEGLIAGAAVLAILAGWLQYRADDTARKLQDEVPVESAPILAAGSPSAPSSQAGNGDGKENDLPAENLQEPSPTNGMATAPLDGLTEDVNGMQLPVIRAADGVTPFEAYKRPFVKSDTHPSVSFVMVDYGLSDQISAAALERLPPDITLALSPYAENAVSKAQDARAEGYEIWLLLPMQTRTYGRDDSGPLTILSGPAAAPENMNRLRTLLGSAVGYAGIISQENHILSQDSADPSVINEITGRGLGFAESNPDIPGYGLTEALKSGAPYVQNNIWIDAVMRPDDIDAALRQVEILAANKGHAVAFFHPTPLSISKVESWIEEAQSKGIVAAPLSAAVSR